LGRGTFIATAVLLAVAAIVLSVTATVYGSWLLAVHDEQDKLTRYAERAILRADTSLRDVDEALTQIAAFDAVPCSPEHIARMRQITINSQTIREIGYFENRVLKCTSWGMTDVHVDQAPADVIMPGGIELTVAMEPKVSRGKPMLALQRGAYNVLVDRERFVDVIVDPDVQLTIMMHDGTVIGTLNGPPEHKISKFPPQPEAGLDGKTIFVTASQSNWSVIASERRGLALKLLRHQVLSLLPLGGVLAIGLVGVVVWLWRRRLSPLGELSMAVKNREFSVVYQPIIELRSGRCVGAEALVRWRQPDGSVVTPDQFIPLAEESGLISEITEQVIATVAADLSDLLAADRALHVSINISARDLETTRVLDVVHKAFPAHKVQPRQVWLEITERSYLKKEEARATINQARARGHPFGVDDFGTGYSSLSYLQELPLDVLKIDKSFIDTIGTDSATSAVCPHIIGMAKTIGLAIVAEGVETRLQADYLVARGVEYGQGWLFSRALSRDDFLAFCERNRRERAA
jgi:sensor c-di-GMP phosphodiesterase-like protein